MKKRIGIIALLIAHAFCFAQDPVATEYGKLITPEDLKEYVSILAADALEGRETGQRGQKMAAAFIASHFESLGLSGPVNGSYYQPFELYGPSAGETFVKAGGATYSNFKEIAYYGTSNSGAEVSTPIVFAGKGRPEDLGQIKVADKAVLIVAATGESATARDAARAQGAKMVFVVSPNATDFEESVKRINYLYNRAGLELTKPEYSVGESGEFFVTQQVAEKIFNMPFSKLSEITNADPKKNLLKKVKPSTVGYKHTLSARTVKSENVLGFLEGTDKKDEIIVVTAHYDHIGKRKSGTGDLINNGADDDASGTSAVMQLAKIFAKAKADGKGPRRSILFMTVSAEELGLLGSDYYTRNPVFPLKQTVVNLNIDMIGRRDAQHKDSAPYVYVIGADKLSTELHRLSEATNNTYTKLIFDYLYNDESHPDRLYYRSDHWNFAKNNVPIIFYFDGIHEDYHRVTDEIDKIEFDLLSQRAQLVFHMAWAIANREQRIVPDAKKPEGK